MNTVVKASYSRRDFKKRQCGVALVEFALVALIFFTILLGIMEFGRWMFVLNAANEATRLGARLATLCDKDVSGTGSSVIKTKMKFFLPNASDAQIAINYSPAGCDASNCVTVEVKLVNATFTPLIPMMGLPLPVPAFTTSLPRELMNSANNCPCLPSPTPPSCP